MESAAQPSQPTPALNDRQPSAAATPLTAAAPAVVVAATADAPVNTPTNPSAKTDDQTGEAK